MTDQPGSTRRAEAHEQKLQALHEALAGAQERELRYRALFNASPEGFLLVQIISCDMCSPDYRLVEANPAFEQLVGASPHGRQPRAWLPASLLHALDEVARRGEPVERNVRLPPADADHELFAFSPAPGQIACRLAAHPDANRLRPDPVSGRGVADELDTLYATAPLGMCVLDTELRYVRINDRLAELNGIPAAAHLGRTVREVVPALADLVEPGLRAVLATGKPRLDLETTGETPAQPSAARTWSSNWWPVHDEAGRVAGISVITEEITARKRMEQALRESEARFQRQFAELETIYRSAPVGLAVLDAELRYRRVNERLADVHGVPAEAHIGKTVDEVGPQLAPEDVLQLRKLLATGEPTPDLHVSGETPAQPGVQRDWVKHFCPLKDRAGRVVGINVVVEEITERLRMEAVRRREHEFRTLAEHSADAILRFDRTLLCLVYANPAATALLALPAGASGMTPIALGLPHKGAKELERLLRAALGSARDQHTELRLRRDRAVRIIETRALPEFDGEGNLETVLVIARDMTERHRAEQALRASERRYRQLVETLNEGIWAIDARAHTTYVNGRMAEMLGYEVGEMLGRHLFAFMDAQGRQLAERDLARRRAGLREEHDFEFLRKDGTRIYVRMNTSPLRDERGRFAGALAGMLDVTERRRAEQALRESEARFRQVVELVPSILYRVPLPGHRTEFISAEVERLIGFTSDEWKVDPSIWVRQLHEEDRERVLAEMNAALQVSDSYTQQYRLWHKDGRQLLWVEDSHRIERDADGQPVALFGAMIDISDRKRAEEALHLREQEFRALAEGAPDIVARIDPALRILYVSPAVERVTGAPPADYLGRSVWEIGLSRTHARVLARDVRAAVRLGTESRHEFSFRTSAGERQYFDTRLVPEFGADGQVRSVISVSRDITRLRAAQAQVRRQVEQLAKANQRLEALSRHDALTGLANRRYLFEYLETEWRREARHRHRVSLIIVDIDHFKAFNDHYGHLAGDVCLRRVADALQQALHRPGDLLARYGGEEFVVVLPETDLAGAHRLAETLRAAVEALRLEHRGAPAAPIMTISLGVADALPQQCTAEDLFARADRALYRAKAAGRNRVCAASAD